MAKQFNVVVMGIGNRGSVYANVSLDFPEKLKIVGIVDPDPIRTELMRKRYNVPKENCFVSVEEFIARDKFADAVFNCTMDHLHIKTSVPVLEKGYDLLLEKPFAVSEAEVHELSAVAKKCGRKVVICHVLRYTDFYSSIKKIIDSGEIGDIISIETCEHVNYHHLAAAFVRGKWRSEKLCFAPMILAKSCHDMDILLWMMNKTKPKYISSFGDDFQFGKERKPEGAGTRCMADCPYVDECRFSSKANYLAAERWGHYVWKCIEAKENYTFEDKEESLKTFNPYGKCVWDFERDGNVDHQTVIIKFANGATGSFNMIGGSVKSERNIHIVGTLGEIKGTFEDSKYVIRRIAPFTSKGYTEELIDVKDLGDDKIGANGGHGGGDKIIVHDFIDYVQGDKEPSFRCTTLDDSKISHLAVFKAEQARKTGKVVEMDIE